MIKKIKHEKKLFQRVLLIGFILDVILIRSIGFFNQIGPKRMILLVCILVFFLVINPIFACLFPSYGKVYHKIMDNFSKAKENLVLNKTRLAILVALYFIEIGCAVFIKKIIISDALSYRMGKSGLIWLIVVSWLITFLLVFRSHIVEKLHVVFFVVVIMIGSSFIITSPPIVGVAPDDEIHYEKSLMLANGFDRAQYTADGVVISEYAIHIGEHSMYDRESRGAYLTQIEKLYKSKEQTPFMDFKYSIVHFGYIPMAVGITIGRALSLGWKYTFWLGKLFNLMTYATLISIGIKKLRYGKLLCAVVGLIPTSIFLASSYNYDAWVTSWIILGFSYFFSTLQDDNKSETDLYKSLLFITIGCLPKAVYFAVLFPFLFVGVSYFKNKKSEVAFKLSTIGAAALLILSFTIPMIVTRGAVRTDARGGSAVDSGGQIAYMIANPFKAVDNILRFVINLISVENSPRDIYQNFAYMGNGKYYVLILLLVVVAGFIDKMPYAKKYIWVRLTGLIGLFGSVVLIALALYVSFTPVGAASVAGVQPRYLIPLVYPAIMYISPEGVELKFNKENFYAVFVGILAIIFMLNIYSLSNSLY